MSQLNIDQAFQTALGHHQAGQLAEAEALYRQILARQPRHAGALHYLGVIAHQLGKYDIAVEAIRQAIEIWPQYPDAHNNLGNTLRDMGLLDEAIAEYRQAIAFEPMHFDAHYNLGNALIAKGRPKKAVDFYRQALLLKPNSPEVYNNLGVALMDDGQLDESIAACRQAIALQPEDPEARNNLGNALKEKGQLDEAIVAYRQAITLKTDYNQAHSNLVLSLLYHPNYDAPTVSDRIHRWNEQHAEPLKHFIQPHLNDRDPERRLRIGYVSADFREHACAHFLIPLLEHHDAQQVEIFCYAQVPRPDVITKRIHQRAAGWRSIIGLTDAQVAEIVRADRIDILIDLNLHTAGNRLLVFAQKPAPVQVTWMLPSTTGLHTIDYRLTDPIVDPVGLDDAYYSEKSVHLPDTFWCYDPLDGRDIPVNSLPALTMGGVTFGCLNNPYKVNDNLLVLWADVLRQVKDSRLLLLSNQGDHVQRTLDRLWQEGIDLERVEFVPRQARQAYLRQYHRIDVALDTLPYNGHTTNYDSFWMGVPVITLVGQTACGRVGASLSTNLSLPELIAKTPPQFTQIAATLAGDLPRLAELRRTLRPRMLASPLMDATRFARNVEAAYHQMWRTWCATSGSHS